VRPWRATKRSVLLALASLAGTSCAEPVTAPDAQPVAEAPSAAAKAINTLLSSARAGCSYGTLPTGAKIELCAPTNWNGNVVFYAHGYVDATKPVAVPDDTVKGIS